MQDARIMCFEKYILWKKICTFEFSFMLKLFSFPLKWKRSSNHHLCKWDGCVGWYDRTTCRPRWKIFSVFPPRPVCRKPEVWSHETFYNATNTKHNNPAKKTCCIAAISANINNATISENTINGQQKTQSNNQKNKQSSCLEWPFNRSLEAFVPRWQETQCSMFCFLRCQEESYQQFRG